MSFALAESAVAAMAALEMQAVARSYNMPQLRRYAKTEECIL